jgi:hypothetical protein
MTLLSSVASADRSDASESTIILDSEGYEGEYLWTENGKDVQVWIESMEGVNGSSNHPIDVYIATSDEYFDHFCGGEGNMFADEFTPVYSKESLMPSELPFTFTYTITSDDTYYLILDNCDNQLTTDYKDDESSLTLTFAVDDESDELADAIGDAAAGLGIVMIGGIAICCGGPFLIIVLLLVRKNKTQVVHVPQNTQPMNMQPQQQFAQAPQQISPPQMPSPPSGPPMDMKGIVDENGYEWIDFQGAKYWRQQNANTGWTIYQ